MKVLEAQNVAVGYRRRGFPLLTRRETYWALKDISLTVRSGETVGVIGRNGAGKSTLLKVLAGIIDPDKGTLARAPGRASLLSMQVGFVNYLSGRENAIMSGMLLGLSKTRVMERLDEIIAFAELGDFIEEPIATYSSGMRARLGFSVAYFSAPDILLIDEVLGVGDVTFREKSAAAIRNLIKSDKTVVLVSHQPSTLLELCDSAVWIENGKTQYQGSTQQAIDDYQAHMQLCKQDGTPNTG